MGRVTVRLLLTYCTGLYLLLLCCNAQAQYPTFKNYSVDNYQVDNGLPSSFVYYVFQDSKGFIWFSTETGVSRYDGYSFVSYTTDDGLTDNEVFTIHEDTKGRIWFLGNSHELCYFKDGKIYNTLNDHALQGTIINSFFKSFLEDSRGNIWLGSTNFETLKVDTQMNIHRIDSVFSSFLWESPDGKVWAVAPEDYYDVSSDQQLKGVKGSGGAVYGVNLGDSILLSKGQWVFSFDGKKERLLISKNDIDLLQYGVIYLYKDLEANIWLGTDQGVVVCDEHLNYKATYLKGKVVSSVLQDREGNFWITTLGDGVFFIPSLQIRSYTVESGLSDNEIFSVNVDSQDRIWVGHSHNQFDIIATDGTIENHVAPLSQAPGRGRVHDILLRGNETWITSDNGTAYYADGKVRTYPFSFRQMKASKQGELWGVGTRIIFNISKLDLDSVVNNWAMYTRHYARQHKGKFRNHRMYSLAFMNDSVPIVGGNLGLFNFQNDSFINYLPEVLALQKQITHVQVAPDSSLWIATYEDGVFRIKDNKALNITKQNGLTSNVCKWLLTQDNGQVWVATNRGLNRVICTNDSIQIKAYSVIDGLASNDINKLYQHNNTLLIATSNGLSVFPLEEERPEDAAPVVYLQSVTVGGENLPLDQHHQLPHSTRDVSIAYVGLSYKSQGNITYRYRLEGWDTTWSYTNALQVEYRSLDPGDYTFLVDAQSLRGKWSKQPASIRFSVAKPFWQEWWFFVGLIVMIVVITWLIVYSSMKRVRRREQRKAELNLRLAEAEQKALRAQMNPHFIFNSLNSIQRFIIKKDTKVAYNYLEKFSRLIRMILENSRYNFITIEDELTALELYLELEELRFDRKFQYSIYTDPKIEQHMRIPSMIIQPYVENAIWHGLMPKEGNDLQLSIQLLLNKESIHCIVEDNGIGRQEAMKHRGKKQKGKTSMGMSITKDRLNIINASGAHVDVKIIDLYTSTNHAAGTRVEILFPVEH